MNPQQQMILTQIEGVNATIERLQPPDVRRQVREEQARRDRLLVEGSELGISERKLCRAAGVTRGWLWKLKERSGCTNQSSQT